MKKEHIKGRSRIVWGRLKPKVVPACELRTGFSLHFHFFLLFLLILLFGHPSGPPHQAPPKPPATPARALVVLLVLPKQQHQSWGRGDRGGRTASWSWAPGGDSGVCRGASGLGAAASPGWWWQPGAPSAVAQAGTLGQTPCLHAWSPGGSGSPPPPPPLMSLLFPPWAVAAGLQELQKMQDLR